MITLNVDLHIPSNVLFSIVGEDAFLLNTKTNKYYGLEKIGAHFWKLITEEKPLKSAYQILLDEYDVDPVELERDILELLEELQKNDLVTLD